MQTLSHNGACISASYQGSTPQNDHWGILRPGQTNSMTAGDCSCLQPCWTRGNDTVAGTTWHGHTLQARRPGDACKDRRNVELTA